MEKYLVPEPAPHQNPNPRRSRRPQWDRTLVELNGRFPSNYRHSLSRLLMDSYSEVGAFPHNYYIGPDRCRTHLLSLDNASMGSQYPFKREGISGLEFDSKGIYLASATKSGCLTVHDFETLYCNSKGSTGTVESETGQLLHISTSMQLDVVRWNPQNQDELVCASRLDNKILLFDIGYLSAEPVEVLEKGRSKSRLHACEVYNGLSDISFIKDCKSRLLACDLEGCIHMWDRRVSKNPQLELVTTSRTQLNSIQLDVEGRVVFGASKHGFIYAWDLRGGRTSLAFQSHNELYHPLLASMKVSSMLEKITSLKAQSNISAKEIHSISFDPSCPYQLSFHLDDGWSGVINTSILDVTHMHCPPPAWLEGTDISAPLTYIRKPSWLPSCSIYAVPCSFNHGIYLLDFYPDKTSACHVDFCEEPQGLSEETRRVAHNNFVPVSDYVFVCAAHPLNGTIVAGTKRSSLLIVSQTVGEL